MARKIAIALMASIFALTATACHTVRGIGQDLEDLSDDVDRAV